MGLGGSLEYALMANSVIIQQRLEVVPGVGK